jgi:mannose/cellobiose epimerase-like protein (N-acyl-D-glucosamine 2-epimerase family)
MSDLRSLASELQSWLFESALPLWWQVGADRIRGGFHEKIGLDGIPVELPHRARTIARQAHCYCEAERLGWNGPWIEAASHALAYLRRHFVSGDRTIVSVVDLAGTVSDPTFDLYNQAFALLAYAGAHRVFGETAGWRDAAHALRATLERAYAHPQGGFYEDRERRRPQRANPHMHLIEAALAWMTVDPAPAWRAMADDIATLALQRFIDPSTGALREFFAGDWSPAPGIDGRIVEPGHQYEWAFLLDRWRRLTGRPALAEVTRLIAFADSRGLDAERGVAVNAILVDGGVHDAVARLWPQCERFRAYRIDRRTGDGSRLIEAARTIRRYLDTAVPGLWMDQMTAGGQFVVEPARATNLYHVMAAVAELSAMSLPGAGGGEAS